MGVLLLSAFPTKALQDAAEDENAEAALVVAEASLDEGAGDGRPEMEARVMRLGPIYARVGRAAIRRGTMKR